MSSGESHSAISGVLASPCSHDLLFPPSTVLSSVNLHSSSPDGCHSPSLADTLSMCLYDLLPPTSFVLSVSLFV